MPAAGELAKQLTLHVVRSCRNPPSCSLSCSASQHVRCGQCLLHLSQRKAGTHANQPRSVCHEQEKQSFLHLSQRKAGTHADHPARHVFLHLSPEKQEPLHCKDSCTAGSHAAVALASRQEKSRKCCMADQSSSIPRVDIVALLC